MSDDTIQGYRVVGPPSRDPKSTSTTHLRMKRSAVSAHEALQVSVAGKGANCTGRSDEFSGDHLPTDRWAQRACLGCPALEECGIFLRTARPAYGVWAGEVRGRDLDWYDPSEKENE